MLQINSGKLYPGGVQRTNELSGPLYSNLRLPPTDEGPIVTAAGRLRSPGTAEVPGALIFEITERFETGTEKAPGLLISHTIEPYIQDFAAIASFILRITCTPDADLCARLLDGKRSLGIMTPPAQLVRQVFDEEVVPQPSDIDLLKSFTTDLIALERKSFLAAMRAVRTYVNSTHRVKDDLELAYMLLVASIESLSQDFDVHRADWNDYEHSKRQRIDAALMYSNIYRGALSAIGTDEAAELLINYLSNVEVGFEAAIGLKEIWDRRNGLALPIPKAWPDFSIVRTRSAERAAGGAQVIEAPFATAIFDAIDALTTEGASKDQLGLAIGIARIAISLPHAERAGLIDRLLSFPGHRGAKQLLLTACVMDGRSIPSQAVLAGIRDFLEELKTKSWMLPQNSWELEGWFELYAFSDHPAAALDALPLLPESYAAPHQLRRLVNALGNSPSDDAELVLKALADRDARFRETYEWVNALEQRRTVSATQYLLDQLGSGAVKLGGHHPWDLSRNISLTMQGDPGARAEIYRFYGRASGVPQQLIERAIAEAPDVEGVLLMIRVVAEAGRDFQHSDLHRALRRTMTEERSSTNMRGAQELHPVSVSELRKALLEMTVGEGAVAALARRVLIEIDVIRDDYGRDRGDRRHPDIASGIPWPLAFIEASNRN